MEKVIPLQFGRINNIMEKQKVWTYKVEDIFEDIPDDPKNIVIKPENAPPIVICFDPIIGIFPYTDHNINRAIDD